MKFIIKREQLLKPLQQVSNLLIGRPIFPILGNLLLQVHKKTLSLTSTNLEVEMIALIILILPSEDGSITVPAHKFLNICRELSDNSEIQVILKENYLLICSGRSNFLLSTLPVDDFPNIHNWKNKIEFNLPQSTLKYLIETTKFSMAHEDVRYYLNGMLFEIKNKKLQTVATNGHRLAICSLNINYNLPNYSVIIPRKGIIEFIKLLDNNNESIKLQIGNNNIRAYVNNFIFTSKLIDGSFPDYSRVLIKNSNKILTADCNKLKQAFSRAAILSNDKFHSVCLHISKNQLKITTNNLNKDKSEEIIDVNYQNQIIEISFNVNYILDVLYALKCEQVNLLLTDSNSSIQITDINNNSVIYVIMPIRL
ncbi:MAG: DNA polymerase III subunit beta [Arsenophonus endosymbiont of Ceratovacuna japonica]